jgi:hypothetical protein
MLAKMFPAVMVLSPPEAPEKKRNHHNPEAEECGDNAPKTVPLDHTGASLPQQS